MAQSGRGMKRASGSKRYPYKWKRAREHYLARHTSCINIGKPGCTGTATVVDHIVDHRGHAGRYWDRKNWQPMCSHCHSVKTAQSRQPQLRLPLFDKFGEPTDKDNHWSEL